MYEFQCATYILKDSWQLQAYIILFPLQAKNSFFLM